MKERITFVLESAESSFDPKKQLRVEKNAIHVSNLVAAREDHFTFGFDELPQEIWLALKQCHELRLRWASTNAYPSIAPFSSRLSPGLHIFYTPQLDQPDNLVCSTLRKVFGPNIPCNTPNDTFTAIPVLSERFASSASFNYHTSLPVLDELLMYALQKVCNYEDGPCTERLSAFISVDYLDLDWDVISQTLLLKIVSHKPSSGPGWDGTLRPVDNARLEVGVLVQQPPVPADPENLALGGYQAVVGEDSKANRVELTFPSRHHEAPANGHYSSSFLEPTGLHPTLRLTVSSQPPNARHCRLHAFATLPSLLFPDKYQLSAPLFLASKNLGPLRAVWGETDLEAPDWAVSRWGSSMLIELAAPASEITFDADIPLHLRYLAPNGRGLEQVEIPWPVVFWACRAEEGTKMNTNPFDRVNLGYDGLFGPKTMFFHLAPNVTASEELSVKLQVPVLDNSKTAGLQATTTGILLAGFFWVLWKLLSVWRSSGPTLRTRDAIKKRKKQ